LLAIYFRGRLALFFRGTFGFADGDHEFGLRSGQLTAAGGSAALADRGKIFADFTRQGNSFEAHFDYRKRLTIDYKAWDIRRARDVG
jgi:hypothetical protein